MCTYCWQWQYDPKNHLGRPMPNSTMVSWISTNTNEKVPKRLDNCQEDAVE